MRSSGEMYNEVALNCSSYEKCKKSEAFSNVGEDKHSCLNCKHFSDEEYCMLDLYDPIAQNIKD